VPCPKRFAVAACLALSLCPAVRADDLVWSRIYESFCLYTPWCGGSEAVPVAPTYSRCRAAVRLAEDRPGYEVFVRLDCAGRDGEAPGARAADRQWQYGPWVARKDGCFEDNRAVRLVREPLGPWGFTTFRYDVRIHCAP
jgi:hypothetical protein